jgi:uncharacterized RDD family membrane protein YckC
MENGPLILASKGQRFQTVLLDVVFYIVFCFILGMVLGIAGVEARLDNTDGHILGFCFLFIYYVTQESISGRTIGKLIIGTKAVNEDGSKLTLNQAFGRSLCRFIPLEPFSVLLGDNTPVGWHDKIPKTIVISVKRT